MKKVYIYILLLFIFMACSSINAQLPEEDIPEMPVGMVDAEDGQFSAVPVDNKVISIIHLSAREVVEAISVPLPEELYDYKLMTFKHILLLVEGKYKNEEQNRKIWTIEVVDKKDDYEWMLAAEIPLDEGVYYISQKDNYIYANFRADKKINRYRAEIDNNGYIGEWIQEY